MNRRPSCLLPLILFAAAGHADPIIFDNADGVFVWTQGYSEEDGACLAVNEPPTQDGGYVQQGLTQYKRDFEGTPHIDEVYFRTAWKNPRSGKFVRDVDLTFIPADGDIWGYYMVTVFQPGDAIGPGMNFEPFFNSYALLRSYGSEQAEVSIGPSAYVGVSFDLDDGTHYGWIHVERDNWAYLPTAWGYESSPDTPITIPLACYADFTGDGVLDIFDFLSFVNAFNAGDPSADCTADDALDLFDFLCYVSAFNVGCF